MSGSALESAGGAPVVAASAAAKAFETSLASGRDGPAWLTKLREAGATAYRDAGLPTTRREDWKYTSLRKVERKAFRPASPAVLPDAQTLGPVLVDDLPAPQLVFLNGRLLNGADDASADGLQLLRLDRAAGDEGFSKRLGQLADAQTHPFAALNQGHLDDVVLVRALAGATGLPPVYVLFLSTAGADPVASHPRLLIEAGSGAELTVLEHYAALDANQNLTNAVTELHAAPNARVTHCRLQEDAATAFNIGGLFAHLDRDASLVSHNIQAGAALARLDLKVGLAAPGAEVELNGLYVTDGRRHVDNHSRVDHLAPHTRSSQDYRGVLDDRSRGVFNGKAVVHPDAQKIEAHQSNNNLLLSAQAEADTKPELEIYADDVKCSHGATVGQLDENAMFYLRSRGIGPDLARALLTFAFAEAVVGRIDVGGVRSRLETKIAGSLPTGDLIRDYL